MGRRSVVEITESDDSDYGQYYMPMYDSESDEQSDDDSGDSDDDSSDSDDDSDEDDDDDSENCDDNDDDDESCYVSESCYDSDEDDDSENCYDDDDDDDDDDEESCYASESCYDSDEDDDSGDKSSYDSYEVEEVIVLSRMKRTKKQRAGTSKLSNKSKNCAARSKTRAKNDVIRKPLKKKISKKNPRSLSSQGNNYSCRKKPATTRSKKGKEKTEAGMRAVRGSKKKVSKKSTRSLTSGGNNSSCTQKPATTRSKKGKEKTEAGMRAISGNKKKVSKKSTRSVTSGGNNSSCKQKPATTRSKKDKIKAGMRVERSNKKKDLGNRPVTFLVFDLETTGLHRFYHRIIEVALADINGGDQSTFYSLVNPGCPIPNSHIHGITTNMVNRPGVPRMQGLIPYLLQFVKSREKARGYVVLVAHNARCFDVPFLVNEFKRCSTPIPSNWLFLDTLPLAREAMKSTGSQVSGRISLQALREHYGVQLVGSAHSAMSDVHSLSEILQWIALDLKVSIPDLVHWTFTVKDLTLSESKQKSD